MLIQVHGYPLFVLREAIPLITHMSGIRLLDWIDLREVSAYDAPRSISDQLPEIKRRNMQLCLHMDFTLLSYFSFCAHVFLANPTFLPSADLRNILVEASAMLSEKLSSFPKVCEVTMRPCSQVAERQCESEDSCALLGQVHRGLRWRRVMGFAMRNFSDWTVVILPGNSCTGVNAVSRKLNQAEQTTEYPLYECLKDARRYAAPAMAWVKGSTADSIQGAPYISDTCQMLYIPEREACIRIEDVWSQHVSREGAQFSHPCRTSDVCTGGMADPNEISSMSTPPYYWDEIMTSQGPILAKNLDLAEACVHVRICNQWKRGTMPRWLGGSVLDSYVGPENLEPRES